MTDRQEKTIAVFGSSKPRPDTPAWELAESLGRHLARAGYRIVNGGYQGTMAASARGARQAGGRTLGVTCTAWSSPPNQWLDEVISTDSLTERLETLIRQADAFIVLPGSTGTLLELVTCWELINKGFLRPVPLVCLGDFWRPVIDTVVQSGETDGRCVRFAGTPEQAVEILNRFFVTD